MCNTYTFDVNLWLKYALSYIFISFIYFLPLVTFGFIKPQYQPKVSKGVAFIRNFNNLPNPTPNPSWGPTEAWEDDRGHQFQAFLQSECERLEVRQQTPRIQASTERKIEIVMDAWFFRVISWEVGLKTSVLYRFSFLGRKGRKKTHMSSKGWQNRHVLSFFWL